MQCCNVEINYILGTLGLTSKYILYRIKKETQFHCVLRYEHETRAVVTVQSVSAATPTSEALCCHLAATRDVRNQRLCRNSSHLAVSYECESIFCIGPERKGVKRYAVNLQAQMYFKTATSEINKRCSRLQIMSEV